MTPKQAETLKFIDQFWNKNGFSPSYQEIADGIGLKSKSSIHRLIDGLRARGWIMTQDGRKRTITVVRHIKTLASQANVE